MLHSESSKRGAENNGDAVKCASKIEVECKMLLVDLKGKQGQGG